MVLCENVEAEYFRFELFQAVCGLIPILTSHTLLIVFVWESPNDLLELSIFADFDPQSV